MRVPAIARWPGRIGAGAVSRELVSTVDIFVTVLALASIPLPSDRTFDGVDISGVLQRTEEHAPQSPRALPPPPRCLFHWRNFHDAVPKNRLVLAAVRCGKYVST